MSDLDRAMALAYVAALTGSQGSTVTLQTMSDAPGANKRRPKVNHWPLDHDRLWNAIQFDNEHGNGVFVMVNDGDLLGRSAANVVAPRALFADDDKGRLAPGAPAFAPLPPSFYVQSKRGIHPYWTLRGGEDRQRFKLAQATLAAHFGTDPAVTDLCRVMRLPGTLHMKDRANPALVKFVPGTGARHTIDDVLRAYPAPARTREAVLCIGDSKKHQGAHVSPTTTKTQAIALLYLMLRHPLILWARQCPEDVSYPVWLGIASNFYAGVVGHEGVVERARRAFHDLSAEDDRYDPDYCDRFWLSLVAGEPRPTLFTTMALDGVPDTVCVGGPNLISAARAQLRGPR